MLTRVKDNKMMDEKNFIASFQKYLNDYIDIHHLRKGELANNMGIGSSTLRTYLKSNRTPSLYSVYRLSYLYNVDLQEMFGLKRPASSKRNGRINDDSFIKGYQRLTDEEKDLIKIIISHLNKKKQ